MLCIFQGISREWLSALKDMKEVFEPLMTGQASGDIDMSKMKPFYKNMSDDVRAQKNRIGGTFAIAQAVTSRELRDHIRTVLPECIFIVLTLTKESQLKRIKQRHGQESSEAIINMMSNIYDLYELPGEGEENTFNVEITDELTPNDVLQKVMEIIGEN